MDQLTSLASNKGSSCSIDATHSALKCTSQEQPKHLLSFSAHGEATDSTATPIPPHVSPSKSFSHPAMAPPFVSPFVSPTVSPFVSPSISPFVSPTVSPFVSPSISPFVSLADDTLAEAPLVSPNFSPSLTSPQSIEPKCISQFPNSDPYTFNVEPCLAAPIIPTNAESIELFPITQTYPYLSRRRRNRMKLLAEKSLPYPAVIIDCNFEDYQTEKELSHLVQQLMLSYGINTASPTPLRLALTGMGPRLCHLLERISGWRQWMCNFYSEDWATLYPSPVVVYLTADSDAVLQSFDAEKVYIIGGMVDRNRHKGLTALKARALGVETARLPIQETISMSGSKVITINQMIQMIHLYLQTQDWKATLTTVIPERKLHYKQRIRRRNLQDEGKRKAMV